MNRAHLARTAGLVGVLVALFTTTAAVIYCLDQRSLWVYAALPAWVLAVGAYVHPFTR